MTALTQLTTTEVRLFRRDTANLFWALAFPAFLLAVLGGVFPGFRDVQEDGWRLVDVYAPIVLVLAVLTVGIAVVPVTLATSRQLGVLRRLATTPVRPRQLLVAQLTVHGSAAVIAAALAIVVGTVVFDVPLPENPAGFAVAFVLLVAAVFAIGLLVGAVAPTSSTAQGIGMAIYFPMLFFSGVYFPRQVMPDGLRTVSDLTPAGAGVQAIQDAWFGSGPALSNLLVMAAYALGAGLLAAFWFRWE